MNREHVFGINLKSYDQADIVVVWMETDPSTEIQCKLAVTKFKNKPLLIVVDKGLLKNPTVRSILDEFKDYNKLIQILKVPDDISIEEACEHIEKLLLTWNKNRS